MSTLLVGLIAPAWPCGGLVHDDEFLAESAGVEILFEPGADEVTVTYAVAFVGDAPDLGWVIPVPGDLLSVEDGDAGRFSELRGTSRPEVEYLDDGGGGGGCGCLLGGGGSKGGDSLSSESNRATVDVLSEGFTGTYDYVVVTATDSAALQAWFDDNGWTGLATEDLDHYIAAGATFAALRVVPEAEAYPDEQRLLPPVRIRYSGDEMSFPAVMGRHGTEEQRATLYVVADSRATVASGWTSEDPVPLSGDSAEGVWENHLAALGADRSYVRTFAGPVDGGFLTRFDTLAPRDVLDDDPILALEDSTEVLSVRITVGDELSSSSQAAVPLSLLWVATLVWRRRRG